MSDLSAAASNEAVVTVIASEDPVAAHELERSLSGIGREPVLCVEAGKLGGILHSAPRCLLFLDADFNGGRALELLPALLSAAAASGRRLVVIVSSHSSDSGLALSATRSGAFRFLTTPVRPALLAIIVDDALAELEKSAENEREETYDAFADYVPPPPGTTGNGEDERVKTGHRYPMERMSVLNNAPEEPGVITFFDDEGLPLMVEWAGNLNQRLSYYVDLHPGMSQVARKAKFFDFLATMDRGQEAKIFDRLVNKFGRFPSLMNEAPQGSTYTLDPGSASSPESGAVAANSAASPAAVSTGMVSGTGEGNRDRAPAAAASPGLGQKVAPGPDVAVQTGRPAPASPEPHRDGPGVHGASPAAPDAGRVTQYQSTTDHKMIEGIRKILAENPDDPDTQDWLAFTLYSNNLLDEAIEWYTRLIKKGSRREEHFFYCGNAFYKKGAVDKALKLWKVAARLNPGSNIARKAAERMAAVQGAVPAGRGCAVNGTSTSLAR